MHWLNIISPGIPFTAVAYCLQISAIEAVYRSAPPRPVCPLAGPPETSQNNAAAVRWEKSPVRRKALPSASRQRIVIPDEAVEPGDPVVERVCDRVVFLRHF